MIEAYNQSNDRIRKEKNNRENNREKALLDEKKAREKALLDKKKGREKALLDELSKNLKDPITFKIIIGREVNEVVHSREFQMSQAYNFSPDELLELQNSKKFFNRLQAKHLISNESGNHEQASTIIENCYFFYRISSNSKRIYIKAKFGIDKTVYCNNRKNG